MREFYPEIKSQAIHLILAVKDSSIQPLIHHPHLFMQFEKLMIFLSKISKKSKYIFLSKNEKIIELKILVFIASLINYS